MNKILWYIFLGVTIFRLVAVILGHQLEQWEQIVWLCNLLIAVIYNKDNYTK